MTAQELRSLLASKVQPIPPGRRFVDAPAGERVIWQDGRVECGDVMYAMADGQVKRRRCGCDHDDGCGALIEEIDQPQ